MTNPETPRRGPGRPPGFKGSVNRDIDYRCANCGRRVGRDALLAKRVHYMTLTKPQKSIRSRTVKWVCVPCAEAEPEYSQPALSATPGMKGTKIAGT